MENKKVIKGYKVFDPDWTCRGFKFEVGKTFEEDVKPSCCNRGFHFCKELKDCFSYYSFNPDNKVAEVIALGDIDEESDDTKCCTNKLQIVKELTWEEVLRLVNMGKGNAGFWNSGNRNSGDWNSGDWNSGDRNSGDWNKTNFSNGCFNTVEPKIYLFNKPSELTYRDWCNSNARYLLNQIPKDVLEWIWSDNMTEEEKAAHPEHTTTGGYLKHLDDSGRAVEWWHGLSEADKREIMNIPNFDKEIFKEITGIDVEAE